jgi:hypothetical protein
VITGNSGSGRTGPAPSPYAMRPPIPYWFGFFKTFLFIQFFARDRALAFCAHAFAIYY